MKDWKQKYDFVGLFSEGRAGLITRGDGEIMDDVLGLFGEDGLGEGRGEGEGIDELTRLLIEALGEGLGLGGRAGHVSQDAVRRYIQEQQGKDVFEYSVFGSPQTKIGDFTGGN